MNTATPELECLRADNADLRGEADRLFAERMRLIRAEAESRLRAQKLDREHRAFVSAVNAIVCDVVEAGADPAEGMRKLYALMEDM